MHRGHGGVTGHFVGRGSGAVDLKMRQDEEEYIFIN